MQNISIDRSLVNVELLDFELKAALPGMVIGISTGSGKVVVHLDDSAAQNDIDNATIIVANHDETAFTTEQLEEQQKEIDLTTSRDEYSIPIDPVKITLEELAQRIMWLEKEIRDLRGL